MPIITYTNPEKLSDVSNKPLALPLLDSDGHSDYYVSVRERVQMIWLEDSRAVIARA